MTDKCSESGKRIFRSHDEAVAAASNVEGVRPYLCQYCYRWHIGHTWKAKRAQRRREKRGAYV